ncbi:hypothetical protein QTP88_011401 [Uroleucon formosanum]
MLTREWLAVSSKDFVFPSTRFLFSGKTFFDYSSSLVAYKKAARPTLYGRNEKNANSTFLSEIKYMELINKIKEIKTKTTAKTGTEYKALKKICYDVHGKPRHSQSQGSVKRANQDIENMIATWLQDNNTRRWSVINDDISEDDDDDNESDGNYIELTTEDNTKIVKDKAVINEGISTKLRSIDQKRSSSFQNVQKQATKMTQMSENKFCQGNMGENVMIKIPDVGRAKCDLRNILDVILSVKDNLYQIEGKNKPNV